MRRKELYPPGTSSPRNVKTFLCHDSSTAGEGRLLTLATPCVPTPGLVNTGPQPAHPQPPSPWLQAQNTHSGEKRVPLTLPPSGIKPGNSFHKTDRNRAKLTHSASVLVWGLVGIQHLGQRWSCSVGNSAAGDGQNSGHSGSPEAVFSLCC